MVPHLVDNFNYGKHNRKPKPKPRTDKQNDHLGENIKCENNI